jgi:hypothetical protein
LKKAWQKLLDSIYLIHLQSSLSDRSINTSVLLTP